MRGVMAALGAALALAACGGGGEPAASSNVSVPTYQPVAPPSPTPTVTQTGPQDFAVAGGGPLAIEGTDINYTIRLPTDVLFDFDKAELRPGATALLTQVVEQLRGKRVLALQVYGHTDAKGEAQYNYRLSLRRAQAVCRWLKAEGKAYTLCLGRGEDEPVGPNENPDGSDNPVNRQLNRRVDIKVALAPDANAMIERAREQAAGARR